MGVEVVCEGDHFGPWVSDHFSLCFIDCFLFGFQVAFIGLFGLGRIFHSFLSNGGSFHQKTSFFYLKIFFSFVITALHLAVFIVNITENKKKVPVISNIALAGAWTFSIFVQYIERYNGFLSNFVIRIFHLLAFVVGSLRMQTLAQSSFDWQTAVHIPVLISYIAVAIFSLFFNDEGSDDFAAGYTRVPEADPDNELLYADDSKKRPVSPEDEANFLSLAFFSWLTPILKTGHTRALEPKDLPPLRIDDTSNYLSHDLEIIWRAELNRPKPSLWRALRRAYGWEFATGSLFKLMNDVLSFAGPVFLRLIIGFVNDPSQETYVGVLYALGMFMTYFLQSLAIHQYFQIVYRVGMKIRSGIITCVYRKAFVLSNSARQQSTVGEITNHMSVDAQRLMDLTPYLHMVWSAPFQIALSLYFLQDILGLSVIGGVAVMVLSIPLNIVLSRKLAGIQKTLMQFKDKRLKTTNEALIGMRVIKFFAWESSFIQSILEVRNNEIVTSRSTATLKAVMTSFWSSTPLLVSMTTFVMYTLLGHDLTADKAFASLALFNILRFPMNMLPQVAVNSVEANLAVSRLQKYLSETELDTGAVKRLAPTASPDTAIRVRNGQFTWEEKESNFSLSGIDLTIPRGSLVAIVGVVGSGKSSLLSALLGDMNKVNGEVEVSGNVAYCSQQAWIQNASLKNGILFGNPMDHQKYSQVLSVCQLMPDLQVLPGGDDTEIGEKGINLSGGQKQRVSLARALYQDADIYLLDDPLSAVDVHVGKSIFEQCILSAMKGKTRVLVTHQLQYMSQVDLVIVMAGGKIVESGSYAQLMRDGQEFSNLIQQHVHDDSEEKEEDKGTEEGKSEKKSGSSSSLKKSLSKEVKTEKKDEPQDKDKDKKKKIISVEERDVGDISWKVYAAYASALGGLFTVIVIILCFLGDQAASVVGNWWLSYWSKKERGPDAENEHDSMWYLGIYIAMGGGSVLFVFFRSYLMGQLQVTAASKMHEDLIHRVMRAPMSFFETTPLGRILNRFSKDVYALDETLPRSLVMFLNMAFSVFGILIVISYVTPSFLTALLPLAWLYSYINQYYMRSSRELKRLDSISRSPIYAHFSETLSGLPTIRAFQRANGFFHENEKKVDENQRAYFVNVTSNRWLGVRLEFVGTCVITFASLFAVLERDSIDPGLAGLSITYALSTTGSLSWLVRMSTDAQTEMVSVERICQYLEIPQEAPEISERRPPHDWPSRGQIEFKDLQLRYRNDLDLVLRGITCHIKPMEKVGVVGRTGAGKSSLMLALFRLVEPAGGQILIDGVNIASVGLKDLRTHLSIIPQDPILFAGTIRSNLDPFNVYEDQAIWDALKACFLAEFVSNTQEKLKYKMTEGGENLSVGQRQLVCLARALLQKAKILVMDEATAAVDFETDSLIQATIRSVFADRTVLTIAHRINTIIDYDKVMVMDKGRVAEFDSPATLLQNSQSIFYSMVNKPNKRDDNQDGNGVTMEPH